MSSLWSELQDVLYSVEKRYVTFFGYAVLAAALVGGSYYGYSAWRTSSNAHAQLALTESLQDLHIALQAVGNPQAAETEVQELFKTVKTDMGLGYKAHKWSTLAPFFLVYQAQAMTMLGEKEEAYQVMQQATRLFSTSSPYYMMYAVQTALRAIDLGKQEGVDALKQLAASKHGMADMAAYYLARYYHQEGKNAEAKEVYSRIVEQAKKEAQQGGVSPFAQMAVQQLETIL